VPTYVVFYNGVIYGYTAAEPPREGETIVLDRLGTPVRVSSVKANDEGQISIRTEKLEDAR
jgi:hypothetical protein